jgi:nucleoside 2-deoxyribosyltransferase
MSLGLTDIYLAGPFFNEEQIKVMDELKRILIDHGLRVCDPRDISPIINQSADEKKTPAFFKEIFDGNITGMELSFGLIAWTDERDTGTSFELGYFYNKILTEEKGFILTFSAQNKPANVMLSQAATQHFKSFEELSCWLDANANNIIEKKHIEHSDEKQQTNE